MTTVIGTGARPEQAKFTTGEEFQKWIKFAIVKAPKMKAARVDEIFTEALRCAPEKMTGLLNNRRQKCSDLGATLKQWDHAVPIQPTKGQRDRSKKLWANITIVI